MVEHGQFIALTGIMAANDILTPAYKNFASKFDWMNLHGPTPYSVPTAHSCAADADLAQRFLGAPPRRIFCGKFYFLAGNLFYFGIGIVGTVILRECLSRIALWRHLRRSAANKYIAANAGTASFIKPGREAAVPSAEVYLQSSAPNDLIVKQAASPSPADSVPLSLLSPFPRWEIFFFLVQTLRFPFC